MRNFDYLDLINRSWDNEILGLVAQIHEYKARQELYLKQQPMQLDRLVEIAIVQSTEASNEIEGIRTTNTRLKQLCADKTTPHNRDEEEIPGNVADTGDQDGHERRIGIADSAEDAADQVV